MYRDDDVPSSNNNNIINNNYSGVFTHHKFEREGETTTSSIKPTKYF